MKAFLYPFFPPFHNLLCFLLWFRRHAEKYVKRGRLDWPEGAASRDSIKAVLKLPRLQVCTIQYIWFHIIISCYNDIVVIWFFNMLGSVLPKENMLGSDIKPSWMFLFSILQVNKHKKSLVCICRI